MKGLARQGVAKVKDASEAEMFCSNFWSIGPLVFEGVHVGSIVLFELKTLNLGAFFYLCTRHCGFFLIDPLKFCLNLIWPLQSHTSSSKS